MRETSLPPLPGPAPPAPLPFPSTQAVPPKDLPFESSHRCILAPTSSAPGGLHDETASPQRKPSQTD